VDEYLSEKEQIERIRQWWSENGWFLIGGAAVAGVLYFGWNQYQAARLRTAEEAAAIFLELRQHVADDDRQLADEKLAELESEHPSSGYLDQARLLVASDNLIRDTDRAIREIEAVVNQSEDEGMVRIARTRLARVLAYDEQYDRALEVLNVADAGEFEPLFSEIRGDIHAARGDTEAAISAYTNAMTFSGGGTVVNVELIQLKLNDLFATLGTETEPEIEIQTGAGEQE